MSKNSPTLTEQGLIFSLADFIKTSSWENRLSCSQATITNVCEDHYHFVLFLQALLSSVKYVSVIPAWKTVKRMKEKRIVKGALIGVLKCLSVIKLWDWKQNLSEKVVPLIKSFL